jgi:preprotein translocase subunit YajC
MYSLSLLASGDSSSGGSPATLLIFLLIPVAMYFLMIRPQRKRMKETAALQSSIGVGDEVVTNSGIYGFVTGVDGDKFWLEIDDDVQIRIARAAIQGRVNSDAADEPSADDATGKGDAGEKGAKRKSGGAKGAITAGDTDES